jgi:hypothetical protein
MRAVRILGLVLVSVGLVACGGGSKAYIPVDSQLRPWQAPTDLPASPAPAASASEAIKQQADATPAAKPAEAPAAKPADAAAASAPASAPAKAAKPAPKKKPH